MDGELQPNFEVIRLYDENKATKPVTKVGILPFVIGGTLPPISLREISPAGSSYRIPPRTHDKLIRILVMKPKAEAKHLGAPAFQIAKGTRRICVNESWCDMREDDLRHADESFYESLVGTALREGEEEVGLKPVNIRRLFDMGGFTFVSASRGLVKPLHMFAAEIVSETDFIRFEATTAETRWMTVEEFAAVGRADHVSIMNEMMARLMGAFFTGI